MAPTRRRRRVPAGPGYPPRDARSSRRERAWTASQAQQLRQPQAGYLQQFRTHDGPFGILIVPEPGPQPGEHFLAGQAAGADQENVTEALFVGEVSFREPLPYLVAGRRGPRLLRGRHPAAGGTIADPRMPVHALDDIVPG